MNMVIEKFTIRFSAKNARRTFGANEHGVYYREANGGRFGYYGPVFANTREEAIANVRESAAARGDSADAEIYIKDRP